jgi:hypothetical protein
VGHFQTNSEAASLPVYWSGPPTGADVLGLGEQGRDVRLVHRPPSFSLAVALLQDAAAVLLLLAATWTGRVVN